MMCMGRWSSRCRMWITPEQQKHIILIISLDLYYLTYYNMPELIEEQKHIPIPVLIGEENRRLINSLNRAKRKVIENGEMQFVVIPFEHNKGMGISENHQMVFNPEP
jgi:hypothetical protein